MTARATFRRPAGEFEATPDSATVIELGDLLFLDGNDPKPASSFTYVTGDLAATQANFAAKFLGVACESSASGETRPIKVMSAGQFEFDCAAGQFEVGDLVGVDDNAGGTALVDQQVIAIGENGWGPVARVVRRYGANTTRVLCELVRVAPAVTPVEINLGMHQLATGDELVTDLALPYPCKLVQLRGIVTTLVGTGAAVISVDKNATTLDDTMTIAAASPVGAVDYAALDDASGDDIILVGDTISVASDGGSDAGVASLTLLVKPFVMES